MTLFNNCCRGHVPYRDSKLTRILQPALGGNANTAIICNITLAQVAFCQVTTLCIMTISECIHYKALRFFSIGINPMITHLPKIYVIGDFLWVYFASKTSFTCLLQTMSLPIWFTSILILLFWFDHRFIQMKQKVVSSLLVEHYVSPIVLVLMRFISYFSFIPFPYVFLCFFHGQF